MVKSTKNNGHNKYPHES